LKSTTEVVKPTGETAVGGGVVAGGVRVVALLPFQAVPLAALVNAFPDAVLSFNFPHHFFDVFATGLFVALNWIYET